jgi:prephenate dehydrogenase
VGLRHIYSGKIHVGILEDLTPDFLYLKTNKKVLKVKIANIEILKPVELLNWKVRNLPIKTYDISVIFPKRAEATVIAKSVENLRGVLDTEVLDIYHGPPVPHDSQSITIRYRVLDPETILDVEAFLKGFGGIIR